MDNNTPNNGWGQFQNQGDDGMGDATQPMAPPVAQEPVAQEPVVEIQTSVAQEPAAEPQDPVVEPQEGELHAEEISEQEIDKMVGGMSNEELLAVFATKMLEDKGMKAQVDEATLARMTEELVQQLNYEINRAILAQLPEDKLNEVEKILDENGNFEAIESIIEEAQVDVENITQQTMLAFREGYLKGAEI